MDVEILFQAGNAPVSRPSFSSLEEEDPTKGKGKSTGHVAAPPAKKPAKKGSEEGCICASEEWTCSKTEAGKGEETCHGEICQGRAKGAGCCRGRLFGGQQEGSWKV